jgi:uncharacterized protein (DUF736 family)
MIIGRFQKFENGFTGSIETLAIQLNPVRFVRRDKGADYALQGPDDGELGAAWRKAGEWGDYLSVKLDCPSLPAPISATLKLTADNDGFYRLNWQRRRASNGREE